jgi:hypothetical protein
MKRLLVLPPLLLMSLITLTAQRPADAPLTGPSGKSDTVFSKSWRGPRSATSSEPVQRRRSLGPPGPWQKASHIVVGESRFNMDPGQVAGALGKTLVAPTITHARRTVTRQPTA